MKPENKTKSENKNEKIKMNVSVDLGEEGFYADSSVIAHNPLKFFLDFKQTTPRIREDGQFQALVKRKVIILDPIHAKLLMESLRDNVEKYENQFGEIKTAPQQQQKPVKDAGNVNYIG